VIIPNEGGLKLPPFFELSAFQTIDSTNVEAKRLAEIGRSEGQVVWALKQESGVGRRGRQWSSPEGNLYCSVLLRPDCDASQGAKLSFLIAVALYDAIAQFLPDNVQMSLKWPNDILIEGRKSAGILLESKSNSQNKLEWLVIGTGINVANYPKVTEGLPAISLKEAGATVKLETLLSAYCHRLEQLYTQWTRDGFSPIRALWLERASGIGSEVTVRLPKSSFQGTFENLDESGALVLSMKDGTQKLVTAGEVFFSGPE
jgi:BirA family transcriptional regulator, biotin operon repressor / biotin---[acetyl-CoA-carboxylase] ligase